MSERTTSLGIFVILAKIGPKLIPIITKLGKALPKLIKGATGVKAAGGAASLGVYTLLFSWQMALSLVVFILIHEYGHLRAMQQCGLKTKGIYLIPGFGGAAVAAEGWRSARNEVYIALMGPLVGLMFIIPMIMLYFMTQNPMFAAIASIMSLINLFNLFPINPLDGGRITKGLLYSFRGSVGFFFSFLSFFLAIFLSWYTGLHSLLYIAFIGLWETVSDYGLNDVLAKFQKTVLRVAGGFFFAWIIPSLLKPFTWWMLFSTPFLGLIVFAYGWDIVKSTKKEGPFIIAYPWVVLKDVFRGLRELVSIKPSDLKRTEEYTPMNGKKTALYSLAYIVTIVVMVALVLYTAGIPGCQLGKEMLMCR